MRSTACKVIACILISFITVTPAFSTTYYIATTGNNANSCAQAQNVNTPKATFSGATGGISCLAAGDTLQARGGNYNEEIYLQSIPSGTGFPTGATTLMGFPGDAHPVVLGNVTFGGGLNNFKWSGIDIDNTTESNDMIDCMNISGGSHWLVTNSEIRNCQRMGIEVYPGNANVIDMTFSYLNIHGAGLGPSVPGGHGVYLSGDQVGGSFLMTGPFVFDHNELHDNTCPGSSSRNCWNFQTFQYGAAGNTSINNLTFSNNYVHGGIEGGVIMGSGSNLLYYNNIIANNGASPGFGEAGLTIAYGLGGSNLQAYNNTIYGTGNGGHAISCGQYGTIMTGIVLRNNILYNNAGGDDIQLLNGCTVTDTNNDKGTNPNFITTTGCVAGFGIDTGSAAHNAGANEWTIFTTDYAGNNRPQAGSWDQGACAVVGTTPPPPANLVPFYVTDLLMSVTTSDTAPGAGYGQLHVKCGTNPGTLKLTILGGTSTTEVTIIDNVGTGVTGC